MTSPSPWRLEDYAEVHIGFKSLLNDFFYIDAERIERFKIESEYLTPILKLGDLQEDAYFQRALDKHRWLFNCRVEPADLRGTGAWEYISWGSLQETRPRKQTEQPVPWPQAPALSHSKHWYYPAATTHSTRIGVRKAMMQKYAPFLFDTRVLLDQRLYVVNPRPDVDWEIIAAYLSSSLFPFALETTANLSLGVGYLTFGTYALRRLPCLDLRALTEARDASGIREAAEVVYKESPPDAEAYVASRAIRDLDGLLLGTAGFKPARGREIEEHTAHFARVRKELSSLKQKAPKASSAADIDAVATQIADVIAPWLSARRYPEDFIGASPRLSLLIAGDYLVMNVDNVLGQCHVRVEDDKGHVAYEDDLSELVAHVLLTTLHLGRREFSIPTEDAAADQALQALESLVDGFETRFSEALSDQSIGTKYGPQVRGSVLRKVSFPLDRLRQPFGHGRYEINRAA
jgi:hypothetical protein